MTDREKAFRGIFDEFYQGLCFYAGKLVKDLDDAKVSDDAILESMRRIIAEAKNRCTKI